MINLQPQEIKATLLRKVWHKDMREQTAEALVRGVVRQTDASCPKCERATVLACRCESVDAEVYVCLNSDCNFGYYN